MENYKKELEVVLSIIHKASAFIKKNYSNKLIISTKEDANDFVTNMDEELEKLIIDGLLESFPDYDILAEESGGIRESNKPKWIIDPIDGTTNFLKGIPIYGISIGLEVDKEIVIGAVSNVPMNEIYSATKGGGAFLNGDLRLKVSAETNFDKLIIGTGFPYKKDADFSSYMNVFEAFARNTAGLRRPGAASVDLSWMAMGRYDAFFEFGLSAWDISAGILLVKEAGGIISDYKGDSDYIYGKSIVASNNNITHRFMLDYISKYYKPTNNYKH